MNGNIVPLGDCGSWLSGGTPASSVGAYWQGDIPWISAATLKEFFVAESDRCVTPEGIAEGSRLVQPDTILMLVRGMSLKTEFRMGIAQRPVAFNQDIKAIVPRKGIDPYYLAYAIRAATGDILDMVEEAGHGTGVLPTDRLKSLGVRIPEIREQSAIAELMRAIDRKIEVTRKIDRKLEEMAQVLFKSWFVDFDPVVTRQDGQRPLGMSSEIAELFPARFQESALGSIPHGWQVSRLKDIVELLRDTLNPSEHPSETFAYYSIPAFDEKRMVLHEVGAQIQSNKYVVPDGVVLISKLNPSTPRVWWPDDSSLRRLCSTEFLVCRPRNTFTQEYIYELGWSNDFLTELASLVTGTSNSHQRVKPEDFLDVQLVAPPQALVAHYSEIVRPWIQLTQSNRLMSSNLTSLRDMLLAKLFSAELTVEDAEQAVGEMM